MSRRSVCLAVPVACLLVAASASAASPPSVAVVGLPIGKIVGKSMPYTETKTIAELSVVYKGSLPHGAKLQLLVKANSISPYKPSKTPVRLSGGHANVHVTEPGIGGPVLYKVALVSGRQQLSVSKAATIYWAQPPGGVFVSDGSESAYTSLRVPSENCESGCKGDAGSEEGGFFSAYAGNSPMPAGWTVTLLLNGTVECSTKDIEGNCGMELAFPMVTAATVVPLVGEVTSPSGKVTKATLLVTVYP
ncbi:MAG TPA: hypothetical protein VGP17_03920 [Solirubrobacteraceae bacterium]|nr:hypothetical protein [Solirubrobacteraceae bacterium]